MSIESDCFLPVFQSCNLPLHQDLLVHSFWTHVLMGRSWSNCILKVRGEWPFIHGVVSDKEGTLFAYTKQMIILHSYTEHPTNHSMLWGFCMGIRNFVYYRYFIRAEKCSGQLSCISGFFPIAGYQTSAQDARDMAMKIWMQKSSG